MAHSHADSHGNQESTYFLDQLCTIAIGGLLGFTAIGLYWNGWLKTKFNLIERFHIPVLIGGIVLILMVLLRAVALWHQAGQAHHAPHESEHHGEARQHDHEHGEACEHDHGHSEACNHDHGHDHAHGHAQSHAHEHSHSHAHSHAHAPSHDHGEDEHDHGWAPWQYAILIVPAVLFFLELPLDGFNKTRLNKDLADVELESGKAGQRLALANLAGSMVLPIFKKRDTVHLKFSELEVHRVRESARDYFDGRTVIVEGQMRITPGKDNEFQLYRVMVNCCGTDALTLQSRIIAPEPLQGFKNEQWVRITGELTFQKKAGKKDDWMPVIEIPAMEKIERIAAPSDPNNGV